MDIYEDLTSTMKKCVYLATPGRQHLAIRIDRREKKLKDSNINKTNSKRKGLPKEWWGEECKDVIKERIDKLKAFKKNRTMAAYIGYRKYCAMAKKTINKKKKQGLHNFIEYINKKNRYVIRIEEN